MFYAKLVPELACSDLQSSLAFYAGLCGFSVLYDRPEDGFAYLDLEQNQIMLDETAEDDETAWWTAAPEKPYGRGINLQMEVSNADAIVSRLEGADWPFYLAIEDKWYREGDMETGNRQFAVQDPDGYLLRFFTHLGKR